MFEKVVIIDCRDHLMGRLASIIAKELLSGQKVVAVRCEELNVSGAVWRNKIKFSQFINKKTRTNPKRGPIHFHSPCKMLWRVVRGMLPHKTVRGKHALLRFKSFEGIPHPYDKMKRMVVPEALRVVRLRPGRKFTNIGELAASSGWKHKELVDTLEDKRKVKSKAFYEQKKAKSVLYAKAIAECADQLKSVDTQLVASGY